MKTEKKHVIEIKNKRAAYEYFFLQNYIAGIQLFGTEIKSIREAKANLSDAFCSFLGMELWVNNLHIAEYRCGSYYNHTEKRARKLLLTKRELKKIKDRVTERGLTIIPTRLFIDGRGYAKLEIAVAKGKHFYDKRNVLKERDSKRDIEKLIKRG